MKIKTENIKQELPSLQIDFNQLKNRKYFTLENISTSCQETVETLRNLSLHLPPEIHLKVIPKKTFRDFYYSSISERAKQQDLLSSVEIDGLTHLVSTPQGEWNYEIIIPFEEGVNQNLSLYQFVSSLTHELGHLYLNTQTQFAQDIFPSELAITQQNQKDYEFQQNIIQQFLKINEELDLTVFEENFDQRPFPDQFESIVMDIKDFSEEIKRIRQLGGNLLVSEDQHEPNLGKFFLEQKLREQEITINITRQLAIKIIPKLQKQINEYQQKSNQSTNFEEKACYEWIIRFTQDQIADYQRKPELLTLTYQKGPFQFYSQMKRLLFEETENENANHEIANMAQKIIRMDEALDLLMTEVNRWVTEPVDVNLLQKIRETKIFTEGFATFVETEFQKEYQKKHPLPDFSPNFKISLPSTGYKKELNYFQKKYQNLQSALRDIQNQPWQLIQQQPLQENT